MDDYRYSTVAINKFISQMTLTRFIDGLNDDLSMHIRSHRPNSLEDAYSITMQYTNAAYRQKLNKKQPVITMDKRKQHTQMQQQPHNNNPTSNPNSNKPGYSGKFRNYKTPNNEDASMRSHISRMQTNNHETSYGSRKPDDTKLDSDDDELCVDDEINFHIAQEKNGET